MMNNNYLRKAKRHFRFAEKELQNAELKKDNIRAQQSAEKGYFCLLRIVNTLLFKKGIKEENFPKNKHHRLYYLRKYTLKERFADLKELLDKVA